jgi:aryl-alcohol dehydrogenase-like predicted oxidoreductase
VDYRRLGRTELAVSPLGLGTYCLTADWGVPRDTALRTMASAAELGVNLVDTAPLYGGGQAEELLADSGLPGLGAVLLDKVGRFEQSIYRRQVDAAYTSPELILAQFRHSLALLRREYVDVLLIHEADWDRWWPAGYGAPAPVLAALRALKDAGQVRHLGIALRDVRAGRKLLATDLFDVLLYVHYKNLVWQEHADDLLDEAKSRDVGVVVGAPYRRGALLRADPAHLDALSGAADWSPGAVERLRAAGALARAADIGLAELGLRFVLGDPRVAAVLVGSESPAQVAENARWAAAGPLPADLRDAVGALQAIPLG